MNTPKALAHITPKALAYLTPKALANFSPGFEEREPWDRHRKSVLTLKRVRLKTNPFRVVTFLEANPGFSQARTLGSN